MQGIITHYIKVLIDSIPVTMSFLKKIKLTAFVPEEVMSHGRGFNNTLQPYAIDTSGSSH
jgi:hypothetical protein